MKRKIFITLVLIQGAIIGILGVKIWQNHQRKDSVLGIVNINPIDRNSIVTDASLSAELKHFYEPTPNQVVTDTPPGFDYHVRYTINADALNERQNYETHKPQKTYRIITLGDSFTFGHYVDTKNNYPEQLEVMLNKKLQCGDVYSDIEVINLGERGYDIRYAVERYKKRGTKYNPDLVIWLLKNDDFTEIKEKIDELVPKYEAEGYPFFDVKSGQYAAISMAVQEMNQSQGREFIRNYQLASLNSIRNLYQKPIIFASLIKSDAVIETLTTFINSDQKSTSIPINSIKPTDRFTDTHLNESGNLKVSQQLFDYIANNQLSMCHKLLQ